MGTLQRLLGHASASARDGLTPWMSDVELSQVLAAFHAASPRRVLEWGSGGSTAHLLREVASIERYVSVEHDEAWAERVRREAEGGDAKTTGH